MHDDETSYTGSGMLGGPPEASTQNVIEVDVSRSSRKDGGYVPAGLMPRVGEAFGAGPAKQLLEPDTAYVVRGRGIFYTDGAGKMVFAEPLRKPVGRIGRALSKKPKSTDLSNPQPGVTYRMDEYTYVKVNDLGVVVHVHLGDA